MWLFVLVFASVATLLKAGLIDSSKSSPHFVHNQWGPYVFVPNYKLSNSTEETRANSSGQCRDVCFVQSWCTAVSAIPVDGSWECSFSDKPIGNQYFTLAENAFSLYRPPYQEVLGTGRYFFTDQDHYFFNPYGGFFYTTRITKNVARSNFFTLCANKPWENGKPLQLATKQDYQLVGSILNVTNACAVFMINLSRDSSGVLLWGDGRVFNSTLLGVSPTGSRSYGMMKNYSIDMTDNTILGRALCLANPFNLPAPGF